MISTLLSLTFNIFLCILHEILKKQVMSGTALFFNMNYSELGVLYLADFLWKTKASMFIAGSLYEICVS